MPADRQDGSEEEWPFEDSDGWSDRLSDYLESTDAALRRARLAALTVDGESHSYPQDQKDYDVGWTNRLRKVITYIEAGHRTIPELEARLRTWRTGGRWKVGEHVKFVVDGKVVSLPARSGFLGFRQLIADTVIDAAQPDTHTVFDLGAGNGDSLFAVWCEGRFLRPRYVGCEPSAAGRKTMRIIASLDPRLHLDTLYFDYRAPSLKSEIRQSGHALVMSTQSIEQVDQVHPDLIKMLCELSPEVTGIHFEPIGWQFPGKVRSSFVEKHRRRCLEKHYNENFWNLLKEAEAAGLIEIVEAEPFAYGYEYNPISKIIWKKLSGPLVSE